MSKFNIEEERKYFTPLTTYMEYLLLKYQEYLKNNLKELDITLGELTYLFNIFYHKELSQKELADILLVSEANVTKMLKKIERKDYIERKKDDANKSRNIICLTKKGELIVYQASKLTIEWETKVSESYTTNEVDSFKDFLFNLVEKSVDV